MDVGGNFIWLFACPQSAVGLHVRLRNFGLFFLRHFGVDDVSVVGKLSINRRWSVGWIDHDSTLQHDGTSANVEFWPAPLFDDWRTNWRDRIDLVIAAAYLESLAVPPSRPLKSPGTFEKTAGTGGIQTRG